MVGRGSSDKKNNRNEPSYGREGHKDRAKVRQWEGSCLCQLD